MGPVKMTESQIKEFVHQLIPYPEVVLGPNPFKGLEPPSSLPEIDDADKVHSGKNQQNVYPE